MTKSTGTVRKLIILFVDDNMCFVERVIGLLDEVIHVGYINIASDYHEACRYIEEERPDLALLDINLPGKNGIELLKLIRRSGQDCRIVMLTNHNDEYYRQLCLELGADYFLDKSNDFEKIPGIIRGLGAGLGKQPLENFA